MKKINWVFLKEGIKSLFMEAAMWPNITHCIPLCPYISASKCSLQSVIGLIEIPWSPLYI